MATPFPFVAGQVLDGQRNLTQSPNYRLTQRPLATRWLLRMLALESR
jgi:hypothetical protein